jgi:hypothetical protein
MKKSKPSNTAHDFMISIITWFGSVTFSAFVVEGERILSLEQIEMYGGARIICTWSGPFPLLDINVIPEGILVTWRSGVADYVIFLTTIYDKTSSNKIHFVIVTTISVKHDLWNTVLNLPPQTLMPSNGLTLSHYVGHITKLALTGSTLHIL